MRRHLTYANVAATLALVIAVAGGTTAIAMKTTAPKNSVISKSIRPGNVTAKDLTTALNVVSTTTLTDPSPLDGQYASGVADAHCPPGTRLLNGGGGAGGVRRVLQFSGRLGEGWRIVVGSDDAVPTTFSATATCLLAKPGAPTLTP
jgi:hypothetical protein